MLIMGQRGYGKTVMLTELRKIASDAGWVVVSETASEGLSARLVSALNSKGWHLQSATVNPSVSIPGIAQASIGGASIAFDETAALTLRNVIAVSYTHLDVYKRQVPARSMRSKSSW